jgi:hypothetical protein
MPTRGQHLVLKPGHNRTPLHRAKHPPRAEALSSKPRREAFKNEIAWAMTLLRSAVIKGWALAAA